MTKILGTTSRDECNAVLCREARKLLGVDEALLYLATNDGNKVVRAYHSAGEGIVATGQSLLPQEPLRGNTTKGYGHPNTMDTGGPEPGWVGGGYPFARIPLPDEGRVIAVLLVGPCLSQDLAEASYSLFMGAREAMGRHLGLLRKAEEAGLRSDEHNTARKLGSAFTGTFFGGIDLLEGLMGMAAKQVGARGGMVCSMEEAGLVPSASWGEMPSPIPIQAISEWLQGHTDPGKPLVMGAGTLTSHAIWVYRLESQGRIIGATIVSDPQEGAASPGTLHVLSILMGRMGLILGGRGIYSKLAEEYRNTLMDLVESTDSGTPHTVGHSGRVALLSRQLAQACGMPAGETEAVWLGAYLHDVGMAGLINITNRAQGRLNPEDYEKVKGHSTLGGVMVEPIMASLPLAPMVRHHHERWDGYGYPDGLKGGAIPLGARIIAVCDTFNAMISSRSYRKPLDAATALENLGKLAGNQLDPDLVAKFNDAWHGMDGLNCTAMLGVPVEMCNGCPALGLRACWESSSNECARHGAECSTCPVRTRYITRTRG